MRRLILMRHGEAENALAGGEDRRRKLTSSGQAAALRCGQEIRTHGFSPDIILCSDAERAVATLEAVVRGAGLGGTVSKILPELYLADELTISQTCCEVDEGLETILLIGHNPGFSETATALCSVPMSLGTSQAALLEHPSHDWITAFGETGRWKLKGLVP